MVLALSPTNAGSLGSSVKFDAAATEDGKTKDGGKKETKRPALGALKKVHDRKQSSSSMAEHRRGLSFGQSSHSLTTVMERRTVKERERDDTQFDDILDQPLFERAHPRPGTGTTSIASS